MAPMGVSPPTGLTNHGGVEALGLLCVGCTRLLMFHCPEVVLVYGFIVHVYLCVYAARLITTGTGTLDWTLSVSLKSRTERGGGPVKEDHSA